MGFAPTHHFFSLNITHSLMELFDGLTYSLNLWTDPWVSDCLNRLPFVRPPLNRKALADSEEQHYHPILPVNTLHLDPADAPSANLITLTLFANQLDHYRASHLVKHEPQSCCYWLWCGWWPGRIGCQKVPYPWSVSLQECVVEQTSQNKLCR